MLPVLTMILSRKKTFQQVDWNQNVTTG